MSGKKALDGPQEIQWDFVNTWMGGLLKSLGRFIRLRQNTLSRHGGTAGSFIDRRGIDKIF